MCEVVVISYQPAGLADILNMKKSQLCFSYASC